MTRKPQKPENNAKTAAKAKPAAAQTFLYLLRHPDSKEIRYAGKANNPGARLKSHIRDARRRNCPLHAWLRTLCTQGKTPIMEVVGCVGITEWEEAERLLIEYLRRCNVNLLNLASGGNQPRLRADRSYLADNGCRTAQLVHGNPARRKLWELRQRVGMGIAWLEKHDRIAAAQKLRAALAKIDSLEGVCP